jgi:nucleotide-binding universal stress UspA family protein
MVARRRITSLDEAINLASEAYAQLRLIYVADETLTSWGSLTGVDLKEALFRTGGEIIDQALNRVRRAGLEAKTAIAETTGRRIENVIVEDARNWAADLIVIGTHGRRGVGRLMLGSVAEGVARLSPVPVMLVHAKPTER